MLNCSLVQSHFNCLILAWGYQCGHLEKNQKLLFIIILTLCLNSKTNDLVTSNEAKFYYKYSDMLKSEKYSGNNITNQGAHHTQNTRQGEHIWTERTRANYLDHRLCAYSYQVQSIHFHKICLKARQPTVYRDSCQASKLFWISMNCSVVNCYVCHYTANKAAMYRKVMFTCLKDDICTRSVKGCATTASTFRWVSVTAALTHWGRDKMAAISQTTFSRAFSWMKMFEFRLKFHWSLFPNVQSTIFQHWFR